MTWLVQSLCCKTMQEPQHCIPGRQTMVKFCARNCMEHYWGLSGWLAWTQHGMQYKAFPNLVTAPFASMRACAWCVTELVSTRCLILFRSVTQEVVQVPTLPMRALMKSSTSLVDRFNPTRSCLPRFPNSISGLTTSFVCLIHWLASKSSWKLVSFVTCTTSMALGTESCFSSPSVDAVA